MNLILFCLFFLVRILPYHHDAPPRIGEAIHDTSFPFPRHVMAFFPLVTLFLGLSHHQLPSLCIHQPRMSVNPFLPSPAVRYVLSYIISSTLSAHVCAINE